MTKKEKLERITMLGKKSIIKEKELLSMITKGIYKFIPYHIISFNNINTSIWREEYLINNDIESTKQRMYNCGRLMDMKKDKNEDMRMDLQAHIFPVILSDSQEVLDRFTKWKYDQYTHKDNPKIEGDRIVSMTTFLQKLFKGNPIEIENEYNLYCKYRDQYDRGRKEMFQMIKEQRKLEWINIYREKFRGKKSWCALTEKDPQIMQGLMKGDKDAIKTGIQWLVSEPIHSQRNTYDDFMTSFISFPAAAYLKAAWILGYEIEIDSPYIPMDLMPVRPLEKYEIPYFFMEEYKKK